MDRTSMQIIKELRDKDPRHMSLRAIEKETGISRSRVDDLFHERMGSPSLQEFVTLCMLFKHRASSCLEEALSRVGQTNDKIISTAHELETQQARERQEAITDDLVDRIAAHPEDFDVAANRDENARLESQTPDE